MWTPFKKLFARSKLLSSLFGDVVFETPSLRGQSSHSVFQWRVKKNLDEKSIFVSLKLIPDGYAGPEGSPTNYINFDIATAEQVRENLDACIVRARQLAVSGNKSAV
jgi:hypothetical protein